MAWCSHQLCHFHAIREAERLIDHADHRAKTDLRIRMPQKNHDYRQTIHKRLREAEEQKAEREQEIRHLQILEEYAAMVEGAMNREYNTFPIWRTRYARSADLP